MKISRRSTLAYTSAFAASVGAPLPAFARLIGSRANETTQLVQHLVIHRDEAESPLCVSLALPAPNTAWKAAGVMSEADLQASTSAYSLRGYGLRRVNAFQTKQGVRYAAIWELGRSTPVSVQTGLTPGALRAEVKTMAARGYAVDHLDAAATDAGPRFAAIWHKSSGAEQQVLAGLTADEYTAQLATQSAQGFAAKQIAGYANGGAARYALVLDRNTMDRRETNPAVSAEDFSAHARSMNARGYELRDASGYVAGGQSFVATVWQKA